MPVMFEVDKLREPKKALVTDAPAKLAPLTVDVPTVAVRMTLLKFTPLKLAERNVAPARTVWYKLVPEFILAPVRFALVSFAPFRFASPKFAYARFAPARFTSRISAFDKLMPVVRTTDAPMM